MPCDTIRSTTVEVGKMNLDILEKGLKAAGYTIRLKNSEEKILQFRDTYGNLYRYAEGTITGNADLDANAIKRAYSMQVVRQTASKFGWKLSDFNSNNQATAAKRRF